MFPEGTLIERQKVLCYAQERETCMDTNRALSMAGWPVVWRKEVTYDKFGKAESGSLIPERYEMQAGILEIDVHGLNAEDAIQAIEKKLSSAGSGVYRIRVIHGFHGGTRIRDAIQRELGYGLEPRIQRIVSGYNQGITELVLREY